MQAAKYGLATRNTGIEEMVHAKAGDSNSAIAAVWATRADELANWALALLVNRTDAYGAYRPEEEISREYTRPDGTRGKLCMPPGLLGRLGRLRVRRQTCQIR
jgi:hypothetical protein